MKDKYHKNYMKKIARMAAAWELSETRRLFCLYMNISTS